MNKLNIPQGLERIVEDIKNRGGRSLLVGGAVIDSIGNKPIQDWDVEVYQLSLEELQNVLSKYIQSDINPSKSAKPKLVGKQFGIIKANIEGVEYDFSIPRKDNKTGIGHTGFEIELVPDMTPKQAAQRRDLTMNSMYWDLDKDELVDPYNGLDDLTEGIIRHTSEQFSEDPLRVLRIMQLLPRKAKTVAPETLKLCQDLVNKYSTLTPERIYKEWNKLLMQADKPSLGLQFLADSGWIKWFPELDILRDTPQNPDWHPEGSVWEHTKMVIDCAAELKQYVPDEWKQAFMYGALLHDVGKPETTTDELTSYGHDKAGIRPARSFMHRLTKNKNGKKGFKDLTEKVLAIVEYHMMPGQLTQNNAKESAWKRLHNKIPLNVIAQMSKADCAGRGGYSLEDQHLPSEKALGLYEMYGIKEIEPVLKGRDLINAGYKPGKHFHDLLKTAYEMQIDEGIDDKNTLIDRVKRIYS